MSWLCFMESGIGDAMGVWGSGVKIAVASGARRIVVGLCQCGFVKT